MKTNSELRALDADGLKAELLALRKEQFNQRMRKASGALDKTHGVRQVRRTIARIKTIITEKAGQHVDK
ncbi:MAG: 50S ribosomal protein L29 [Gammaproteobacteria bacterium]|nr:50S ribosomal protein L29 [Gammaproteobacteria bacterium]